MVIGFLERKREARDRIGLMRKGMKETERREIFDGW